jgi:SAM-dependent methyltransferase
MWLPCLCDRTAYIVATVVTGSLVAPASWTLSSGVWSLMDEAETPAYWSSYGKDDLIVRVAALHAQRRELLEREGAAEIHGARSAIAQIYLRGSGIEVGAGARPFPLPAGVQCFYGDVRDRSQLVGYFGTNEISLTGPIDAQTMHEVPPASLDFVISAHVIEHLFDPVGAIRAAVGVLKPGGVFVCVVPDMDKTWDRMRPPTTLAHLLADYGDGGQSTRLQAYIEHVQFVHPTLTGEHIPTDEIEHRAQAAMVAGMDLHVHAWRAQDFSELLHALSADGSFSIEAAISVGNENVYALRRSHAVHT